LSTVANSPDWHSPAQVAKLPLSTLDRKVLQLVVEKGNTLAKKPRKTRAKPRPR
jgi:hypothetical protein